MPEPSDVPPADPGEHAGVAALRAAIAHRAQGFLTMADEGPPGMTEGVRVEACLSRLVAQEGEGFVGRELPTPYKRKQGKEYYSNAANLTLRREELAYVEGFVIGPDPPLPIPHAWCVDPEGGVVDVTLAVPERSIYLGVRFSREEIASYIASGNPLRPLMQRLLADV